MPSLAHVQREDSCSLGVNQRNPPTGASGDAKDPLSLSQTFKEWVVNMDTQSEKRLTTDGTQAANDKLRPAMVFSSDPGDL